MIGHQDKQKRLKEVKDGRLQDSKSQKQNRRERIRTERMHKLKLKRDHANHKAKMKQDAALMKFGPLFRLCLNQKYEGSFEVELKPDISSTDEFLNSNDFHLMLAECQTIDSLTGAQKTWATEGGFMWPYSDETVSFNQGDTAEPQIRFYGHRSSQKFTCRTKYGPTLKMLIDVADLFRRFGYHVTNFRISR